MRLLQSFGWAAVVPALLAALLAPGLAAPAVAAPLLDCKTRSWVVGPSDSLSSIALAVYGDANRWEEIYAANRKLIGPNPNLIIDGTRLTIPPGRKDCKPAPKPQPKPAQPAAPAGPAPGAVYTVREGDSLASIARAAFGNEAQWEKIYSANRAVIGAEPIVRVGMRLSIPRAGGVPASVPTSAYVVKAGDSLSSIARAFLGNESQWPTIYDLNRDVIGAEPIVQIGQRLQVPNPRGVRTSAPPAQQPAPRPTPRPAPRPAPAQPATPPGTVTYVVKAGDTLADIAIRFYGDPMRLIDIYNANRDVIGPDPENLKVGITLTISNPTRTP